MNILLNQYLFTFFLIEYRYFIFVNVKPNQLWDEHQKKKNYHDYFFH